MKKSFLCIGFVLSIGIVSLMYGCNQKPVETQLEFYYYPKSNMYFDVAKNNFLFSLDGAKTWDTLNAFAQQEPEVLGDKVVLYAANDSIWLDNEAHRRAYNGKLYNIFDFDTITISGTGVVTEKVKKKVIPSSPKVEDEKPKKGLKKLLNKIFGKRDDKKSND